MVVASANHYFGRWREINAGGGDLWKTSCYARESLDTRLLRGGAGFSGTNDFLVVWIRQKHKSNNWPQYQLYAYDQAGVACVGNSEMTYGGGQQGDEVAGIRFDALPRRAKKKLSCASSNGTGGPGQQTVKNGVCHFQSGARFISDLVS